MTSSGWTRQHRCEYRQTTVQEPWGATPVTPTGVTGSDRRPPEPTTQTFLRSLWRPTRPFMKKVEGQNSEHRFAWKKIKPGHFEWLDKVVGRCAERLAKSGPCLVELDPLLLPLFNPRHHCVNRPFAKICAPKREGCGLKDCRSVDLAETVLESGLNVANQAPYLDLRSSREGPIRGADPHAQRVNANERLADFGTLIGFAEDEKNFV